MKCSWCNKKEVDGIAVGTAKPIYCKECQLDLLKRYGMGTQFSNQLLNQLHKKCSDSEDLQKRQGNSADKIAKGR